MMQRQYKIYTLLIAILFASIDSLKATDWSEEPTETRLAQLTFITPLGTNGIRSSSISNSISLNLVVGVSGGVRAFEFGGFHNTTRGDVKGVQIGGFGNVVTGQTNGVQFGGLYNVGLSVTEGVQFAGFTNVIHGPSRGAQFSGLSNVVTKESWAFQASGLANVAIAGNHGVQIAGLTNIDGKEGESSQVAGLANVNYSEASRFQAAGLANVSTNRAKGAQIAGLFNYARRLHGFQLALINVTDTLEKGVPLGLISVVKGGYYAFEVEANDAFWINATYKMGVPKLYNIFTIGFKQKDNQEMWGVGLGLGSLFEIGNNWGLNIDLTATHINENEWWTEDLNLLNRLKINAWYDLGPLQVYGGPSINVHVSNLQNNQGEPGGNLIDPGLSFYNEVHGSTRTLIYPGFNFGIRF